MGTACSQGDTASNLWLMRPQQNVFPSLAHLDDAQRSACGTRTRMLSKQERRHRCTIVRREQLAGRQPGHLQMPWQLKTLLGQRLRANMQETTLMLCRSSCCRGLLRGGSCRGPATLPVLPATPAYIEWISALLFKYATIILAVSTRGPHRKVVVLAPDLHTVRILVRERGQVQRPSNADWGLLCTEVALRWVVEAVMQEVPQLRHANQHK